MQEKPIIYATIPEFDQATQYIVQLPAEDKGDHFFMGVEIRTIEPDEEGGMEM